MREFEQKIPGWRQQTEYAFFRTERGDIGGGTEFTVFTSPGIDFVVKVPKNPKWMEGYRLVEEKAPELAIPFVIARKLKLNVDRIRRTVPESVVQLKVPDFARAIYDAGQENDPNHLNRLILSFTEADKNLFEKGVFIPDPKFDNFGEDREGKVKCLDFSAAEPLAVNDLAYSFVMHGRASAHYSNYMVLKTFCDPEQKHAIKKPSQVYAEASGIPAHLHPKAQTDIELIRATETGWDPDLALYFAEIGDEEFRRTYGEPPFKINVEFIRRLPYYVDLMNKQQ